MPGLIETTELQNVLIRRFECNKCRKTLCMNCIFDINVDVQLCASCFAVSDILKKTGRRMYCCSDKLVVARRHAKAERHSQLAEHPQLKQYRLVDLEYWGGLKPSSKSTHLSPQ